VKKRVTALNFIALQRRRDGRYGFLDRLAEKPEQTADPDTALFLPMTLNAAWLFKTRPLPWPCLRHWRRWGRPHEKIVSLLSSRGLSCEPMA